MVIPFHFICIQSCTVFDPWPGSCNGGQLSVTSASENGKTWQFQHRSFNCDNIPSIEIALAILEKMQYFLSNPSKLFQISVRATLYICVQNAYYLDDEKSE